MMPLADFFSEVQQDVDRTLRACLADLPPDTLRQAMEYSLFNGGKRIRPALCYAAGQLFAPATELTHRAAAALELIHAYSLIHDDLPAMDDDDLRRGKPTCHIAFGEATAILAGDAMQALAFEILAEGVGPLPANTRLQLIGRLSRAAGARGMVLGQSQDLAAVRSAPPYEHLEAMHRHKTGALIGASIEMGALASGRASEEELQVLAEYADAVGLAFQVKDDILDVESSTEALGKTQGADLARNKLTYTSLLGMDGAKGKLDQLHTKATAAAGRFGERGRLLTAIADFIAQRSH